MKELVKFRQFLNEASDKKYYYSHPLRGYGKLFYGKKDTPYYLKRIRITVSLPKVAEGHVNGTFEHDKLEEKASRIALQYLKDNYDFELFHPKPYRGGGGGLKGVGDVEGEIKTEIEDITPDWYEVYFGPN